ncbi:MAG TPA: flavin reductase family protein [Jatrophihabitans sp.]|uniref:flavin reductase family protein n=1 Tax=Jatrophihabitans sp. TaxID=1932789 RepID=UPI002EE9E099
MQKPAALPPTSGVADVRDVMRSIVTGVCLATTYRETPEGLEHDAQTVNSLTEVSMSPPLVSICLPRDSPFLQDLRSSLSWGISILDVCGDDIAVQFAQDRPARASALAGLGLTPAPRTGALVMPGRSWLECELFRCVDAGDHTVVIGEVLSAQLAVGRPPLIYLDGQFRVA